MHIQHFLTKSFGIATLALSVFIAPISQGQPESKEESEDAPMTSWPVEKQPRMQGKYLQVQEDGHEERRIRITSGSYRFVFEDDGRWILDSSTTPRYSIMMNDRLSEDLTFGIAQFRKGEFLASLSDDDWNPYVESIKKESIPKKIVYQHYTAQGRSSPYIMKNWTRKIEYEYPLSNDKIGKTREIFSFIDGDLFVFIFSGIKEEIDANREYHNLLLTRMNIYTDS